MKATIELGKDAPKLFSAAELKDGDVVHFAGEDSHNPFPVASEYLRFVTTEGLIDVDGVRVNKRDNTDKMYTYFPTGTVIKLEV